MTDLTFRQTKFSIKTQAETTKLSIKVCFPQSVSNSMNITVHGHGPRRKELGQRHKGDWKQWSRQVDLLCEVAPEKLLPLSKSV